MSEHNVPIIVIPYRDRKTHLDCILARFARFHVVVVEQCDNRRFNRGALLNIGFNKALSLGAKRVILHDCDLVPDDTLLTMYTDDWPRPIVHFGARFRRYNNWKTYFGGVHGFHVDFFPGYPNQFWGWGGEDDALRTRVELKDVTYAKKGEYLDLEGYSTAKQKLQHTPYSIRCANKHELLRTDCRSDDNHIQGIASHTAQWDEYYSECLTWGYITFY